MSAHETSILVNSARAKSTARYIYIQVKKKAFKIKAKIEDVGLIKKVWKQEMVTKFS